LATGQSIGLAKKRSGFELINGRYFSHMNSGKKNYGRLGHLRTPEWKRMLRSNKGLFQVRNKFISQILGPHMTDTGVITGGLGFMENVFFSKVCTKDQAEFFEEIISINPTAAREFMFTISNSIDIWKEDIRLLEFALKKLEKEDRAMHFKENLIQEANNKKITVKLPSVLKRHFPQLFNDVELEGIEFNELIGKIKSMEEKVEAEEHYIKDYLHAIRKVMPFLFE
jgi:hypothetical protein